MGFLWCPTVESQSDSRVGAPGYLESPHRDAFLRAGDYRDRVVLRWKPACVGIQDEVDIPFPDPRSRTYGVEGEESDSGKKGNPFVAGFSPDSADERMELLFGFFGRVFFDVRDQQLTSEAYASAGPRSPYVLHGCCDNKHGSRIRRKQHLSRRSSPRSSPCARDHEGAISNAEDF